MKIVDRKTFLAMPKNTLFSEWEPCCFDDLKIKGQSLEDDFFVQDIADAVKSDNSEEFIDVCEEAARTGKSIDIDLDCIGRDGCFDEDQMFAVWEYEDVVALIKRLQECLPII